MAGRGANTYATGAERQAGELRQRLVPELESNGQVRTQSNDIDVKKKQVKVLLLATHMRTAHVLRAAWCFFD